MSIFYCEKCSKEYNSIDRKPLSLPCGDVFCEQCIYEIYDKKNHIIICPSHKNEISIELNKIPICSKILMNLKRKNSIESKDNFLYCIRHKKIKLKYFCEQDRAFLCENCLSQHNGHKYVEFKLNKENFSYEINILKNNFENIKNKYLEDKHKINLFISLNKKHIDEQIFKINNYFNSIINIINDTKNKYISKLNNIIKEKFKQFEKIQNIFSISDEKYSFINNEFYYITNDLLNKGEYETFYNLKINFIQEIKNFEKYININVYKNNEIFINNKLPTFIIPKNGLIENNNYDKKDEIFGKFEDKTIETDKNSGKNSPRKKINNNEFNNSNIKNINQKGIEKEKVIINNINKNDKENISDNSLNNNNLDSSLITKKSNMIGGNSNINDSSFLEKQLIDTGYTFFLINKNDVKNVFKQQDYEQSPNELINIANANNKLYNNSKDKIEKFEKEENLNNNNLNNFNKYSYSNNNIINNIKNNGNNNNNLVLNNNSIINKNNLNNNNIKVNGNQNNKNNNYNNQNYNNINSNYNINQNNNQNNNNINNNLTNILSNLNNLNTSSGKKPYKLLNILNNTKENNYIKKTKEKHNYQRISKNRENINKSRDITENNNKEIYIKKSFYDKEKSAYLMSYNNNSYENKKIIKVNKSEDNCKNKITKTKINNVSKKRDNSTKRMEYREHNSNSNNNKKMNNKRVNSIAKKMNNNDIKRPISYIYANMNNSNSIMNNNLVNSYNKEYSNDYIIFNKNNNEGKNKKKYKNVIQNNYNINKYNSQNLTELNDDNNYNINLRNKSKNHNKRIISDIISPEGKNKDYNESVYLNKIMHKKVSKPKYSLKDIEVGNKNIVNKYDNNRFNENKSNNYDQLIKRGRSTRQKYSNSEINSMDIIF